MSVRLHRAMWRLVIAQLVLGLGILVAPPAGARSEPAPTTLRATVQFRDAPGVVTRHGSALYLDNEPFRLVGAASPGLTSDQSINLGCGGTVTQQQLDETLAALPVGATVSVWAPQAMAWNRFTSRRDFRPIDRVVDAAQAHGLRLILNLEHQAGYCSDSAWKQTSWYAEGWRLPTPLHVTQPESFESWVRAIVARYAARDVVAGYVPVVEPDASTCGLAPGSACYGHTVCPVGAAAMLRRFFDDVGTTIRALAPRQLVISGAGGAGCGLMGDEYAHVHKSRGLDACDMHPYEWSGAALDDGVAKLTARCISAGKVPLITEWGVTAGGPGCMSIESRATRWGQSFDALRTTGNQGYLVWFLAGMRDGTCSLLVPRDDPVLVQFTARLRP